MTYGTLQGCAPLVTYKSAVQFAYAEVYGDELGIEETKKLRLTENRYYHALLGRLYTNIDPLTAGTQYRRAIALTKSPSERRAFRNALEAAALTTISP
jgi:predicted RNA polymerase sigma factor